jgi:hypothetical protein
MTIYTFSPEKNLRLIQERGISFDEVIALIENDQIIDILEHPNQDKYGNQKIYVVCAKEYMFLVPFVTDENGNIFLKTIIPTVVQKLANHRRQNPGIERS